jgi:hypothetical protein
MTSFFFSLSTQKESVTPTQSASRDAFSFLKRPCLRLLLWVQDEEYVSLPRRGHFRHICGGPSKPALSKIKFLKGH